MRWDRPENIGKTVEVKSANRPIRIAFFVPYDDTLYTHSNIDAIFFESYTRWAGACTLIIPTDVNHLLEDGYWDWLRYYDPDFIYSYVDIETSFIEKVDRLCCPISILKHEKVEKECGEIKWRNYLPKYSHYIQPISSISTVLCPGNSPIFYHDNLNRQPLILTQYGLKPTSRFLADNFGIGFDLHIATNPIAGYFDTISLVPMDLPDHVAAGTKRCVTALEAFQGISERKVLPISHLAMVNSTGMVRPRSSYWTSAFHLFVGDTPSDRIHFWNSRHLRNSWSDTPNSLMLESSFFDDDQLVEQLGDYLNKNNFIGNGNGQYSAEIHSYSIGKDDLEIIKDKLKPYTWNTVNISKMFNAPAVPEPKDLLECIPDKLSDTAKLKLTEDICELTACEPAHLTYIPQHLRGLGSGQWIVELNIQRHNNLSKYSNVVDTWKLPRRRKITRAFTNSLAKPTLGGRLAVLPGTEECISSNNIVLNKYVYELNLPSDEHFFRHLILNYFQYPSDDLRSALSPIGYIDLDVSDKGQNLRGVISMFGHLSTAFSVLTQKYWRTVFEAANNDSANPLVFQWNKLDSLLPKDRDTIQRLTSELHFKNDRITRKYLRDSLTDTLDHLVRLNVFYLVALWRCDYCGHLNSRGFDQMKIKNECDICSSDYFLPIDIEWKYQLNEFVYRSLHKHSGLPVLWALGFLQDRLYAGSFWYLPEVDLYSSNEVNKDKNEIDILCVIDGKFCAVEAKRSAFIFLNQRNAIDKFVNIINSIRPDVAILAFEKYCHEDDDIQLTKEKLVDAAKEIRDRIGPWTKLEVIVADDTQGFNDISADFGLYGPRVLSYRQSHL